MTDKRLKVIIVLIFVFMGLAGYSQPPVIPPTPPPANPVPISGIEILIGAGALLGAKRMISKKKLNP